MTKRQVDIDEISLEEIRQHAENANLGTAEGASMIRQSIGEHGFVDAGILDKDGVIISGNQRVKAAMAEGMDEAVVIDHDGSKPIFIRLTDYDLDSDDPTVREKSVRLAYAINRSQQVSFRINADQLRRDFGNFDLSGLYTRKDIPKTYRSSESYDTEKSEELTKRWGVEEGQVWKWHEHIIACADSLDPDNIAKLVKLYGKSIDICFTSPPYNMGDNVSMRGGRRAESAYNENNDSQTNYLSFLESFYFAVQSHVEYVLLNIQMLADNKTALTEFVYNHRQELADTAIWVKSNPMPAMAQGVMNSAFEFIHFFECGANAASRNIKTGHFRGTVSNVYSGVVNANRAYTNIHRAIMPIDMAVHFLANFCNQCVLDPFGGSGTTLLAADTLGLHSVLCEKEPGSVALILERIEKELDGAPELHCEISEISA